jgi:hypothetical protein
LCRQSNASCVSTWKWFKLRLKANILSLHSSKIQSSWISLDYFSSNLFVLSDKWLSKSKKLKPSHPKYPYA